MIIASKTDAKMNDSRPLSSGPVDRPSGTSGHLSGAGLVPALLRFAAATAAGNLDVGASGIHWDGVTDRQVQDVLDAGLGPLLFHATRESQGAVPDIWRDALHAEDLTARVRHGNLCDAMLEILDACNAAGVPVTLLKGISIADQCYPLAHLRPMGDIDILVSEEHCIWIEEALLHRGYEPKAGYVADAGEPHRAPLLDPKRGVWVEVHTALFPAGDRLVTDSLFSAAQIAREEVASTFHGRPVRRLSREMQLAYIASYWIRDLSRNPFHPSFVTPLVDAILLLEAAGPAPDWDRILACLDNEMATASLHVMLSYISSRGLASSISPIASKLASRQHIVGAPERRMVMSMIDANLVGGRPFLGRFGIRHPMIALSIFFSLLEPGSRVGKLLALPWNVLFPPWLADRYTLRYHADRVRRFLRR